MIHIKDLSLSFGAQTVFDEISLNINQNAHIGLVGCNGSGKSTLLKVVAKQQLIDGGGISILPGKRVAYMPQEVVLLSDKTILQETMEASGGLATLQKELAILEALVIEGEADEKVIDRYVTLQEELTQLQPEQLQLQAERILLGLGFKQEQLAQPVSNLSVGWKMRIVLAKLLLQKADFYLFDEPTNHLDIVAKDWFIHFLKTAPFGFLLVCHERYFLDQLCTTIIALEQGKAKVYNGNYSAFEVQYENDMQQLQAAYNQQQKEIKQKIETIERYKAKASKAKMAKSMQKKLDTVERIIVPRTARQIHFNFPETQQSGRIVLTVENVAHSFDDKKIFDHISLKIERGNRIALVAANGVGKTTLFNVIVGNLPLQKGSLEFGHNVRYTIFAQDQNQSLDLNKTIFENAYERCAKKSEQQIRSFLGAFLFSGDDIQKKVRVLSGGEKNRVAMAIVLMQDSNFLLLDEPTNHLDMPSKETLIAALKEFKGTIFFVSHDHAFINALATHIIELTPHRAYLYEGNYDAYLHQKKEHHPSLTPEIIITKKEAKPLLEKKPLAFEQQIDKVEKEIGKLQQAFQDIAYGTPKFKEIEQRLARKQQELEQLTKEWEALLL